MLKSFRFQYINTSQKDLWNGSLHVCYPCSNYLPNGTPDVLSPTANAKAKGDFVDSKPQQHENGWLLNRHPWQSKSLPQH